MIKTRTGKTITLSLADSDTILDLKKYVSLKEGCAVNEQRLIYAGKLLEDNKTCEDYNIQKGSELELVFGYVVYFQIFYTTKRHYNTDKSTGSSRPSRVRLSS